MNLRTRQNIVSIRTEEGDYVGFHSENLEVASLDESAWLAMTESHGGIEKPTSQASLELNVWNQSRNPDSKNMLTSQKVRSITINVTQLCNFNCSYCAANGDGTYGDPVAKIDIEQTIPQLKYFLNALTHGDHFHIHFLGGEPLLYPKAIETISKYAQLFTAGKDISLKFSITTNGTLLTEKNIQLLTKLNCHVQISLDGPPEINDKQRHSKKSPFNTSSIVQGLKRLQKEAAQLGSIGLSAVFNENNMNVVECYEFLDKFDTDWIELTFSFTDKSPLLSQQYAEQMQKVASLAYKKNGLDGLKKIKAFNNILNNIDQRTRIRNYCGAGKDFLMIDARNQIYSCPWDVGTVSEKIGDLDKIDQRKRSTYKKDLVDKKSCQTCWARFLCGGGCMFTHKMATGNKKKVDKDFCDRTRSLIATAIIYYEREGRKNDETYQNN